jgi:predicted Na+-dependent transporter
LAKENFVNPAVAVPAAISSLVHSLYGSIFVALFGIKANGFSSEKDDTNH